MIEGVEESLLAQPTEQLPTDDLMALARQVRAAATGTRVTFSPKVFVPLTRLCRDRCGYCTFATAPRHVAAPYLTPEEVLAIASQGADAGCHEALFTLGEAPEERYAEARAWLEAHGYVSTVDYLVAMCRLVLEETGLLPHANAGAIGRAELARLREVAPSQGMMVESLRPDLAAHRGAPDKTPERRLATLEWAGELAIPFTTGILVGIGETEADRLEALEAIAASHRRHGHVQEVIVQNFLPKPGTAMRGHEPCPPEEHLRAIALARLVLPADVHVQAPPNLSDPDRLGELLDAGIDDWGGVSPVTPDHVNPERPWPAIEVLREATEDRGLALAPRLTIYPEYAAEPARWLDEATAFPVLDRSDAEALGRDDPGAIWPERHQAAANVGTGAEVVQIGRRSTGWYSGADTSPPALLPARGPIGARAGGAVAEVLAGVRAGQEPGEAELVTLFGARGPEVAAVAELADELRAAAVGDTVTYVVNRNINYTNVCTFKCTFCGFSKGPLSLNLRGKPYLLTLDEVAERTVEAATRGATEVCLQGGIHPSFDGDFYIDVTRAVKEAVPRHPRARVHRTRGHRGRQAARRAAGGVPHPTPGRRSRVAARHRGGDPRRRGACGAVPRQGRHRGVARGAPGRPPGRAALQHHHHVRLGGASGPLGPPPDPHEGPAEGDRRVHRVRAAALRAHGRAGLPQAGCATWPHLARVGAHARRGAGSRTTAGSTTSRRRG